MPGSANVRQKHKPDRKDGRRAPGENCSSTFADIQELWGALLNAKPVRQSTREMITFERLAQRGGGADPAEASGQDETD